MLLMLAQFLTLEYVALTSSNSASQFALSSLVKFGIALVS